MAETGPAITFEPARIGRALLIALRFAALGPMFGALAVMATTFVIGIPTHGLGAIAPVAGFSWLFVIVAYFIALLPAAATGLFTAIEFVLRGRVSWLGAAASGLLAMHLNHVMTGNTFMGPSLYWIGVFASLCTRACFNQIMRGEDLPRQTLTITLPGFLLAMKQHAIGGRVLLTLVYLVAVPPLVALPYLAISNGNLFLAVDATGAYFLSLILGSVGFVLLAFLTKSGSRVTLVNALWTQLPVWGLVVINGRYDQDELALLMAIALAATTIVTLAIGKRLAVRGDPTATKRKSVLPALQAWFFPAPRTPAPLRPLLRVKNQAWRTALVFTLAMPPLAMGAATPFMEHPLVTLIMLVGIIPPYVVFGLSALGAGILLALLTPRGKQIALLHAAWTSLPGFAVMWIGISNDRIWMMSGMTLGCMAASVVVAAMFRRKLADPA